MTNGCRQEMISKGEFREETAPSSKLGTELSSFKAEGDQEANVTCRHLTRRKVA